MLRHSLTLKLFVVGLLIVALLVPVGLVTYMVSEREERRTEAVAEVSASWSGSQQVSGPVLIVPVRLTDKDKDGKPYFRTVLTTHLPESLSLDGTVDTERRRRGIYDAVVYSAALSAVGTFLPPDLEPLALGGEPLWDQALVALGLSDLRGVREAVVVRLDQKGLSLEPGAAGAAQLGSALSARVPRELLVGRTKPIPFSFKLSLKGSQSLYFLPLGKTTEVSLASSWDSPSFRGAFLPDSREVRSDGFLARWKVLHINRDFPQSWAGERDSLGGARFGVDLLVMVDHYARTMRAVKYAVLFIFFTFLAFFFIEFFGEKRLHPIQYLLVGSGVVLFYLLLLSLSEHVAFHWAYLAATLGIGAVITGYSHGVFRRGRVTATVAAVLGVLYAFLYALLCLEDYALLLGSAVLLGVLAAVMYMTRRVDWYDSEALVPPPSAL
ncbi:MAG: cell envelope integrity protein CreD [Elusimicrobia bacterium]|nr:cell envelope integrity protein CreD [Elusimicrobiota bacterium]